MPKIFTDAELKNLFSDEYKSHFRQEATDHAYDMRVHADGLFPDKLLKERRPNEPEEVLKYREKIFVAKTKPTISKIISSLSKIRRSSDWSIRYEGEWAKISDEETLEKYCETDFPDFTSVTNWVFSVLLKKYLVDPNAVMFIYPKEIPLEENIYLKPIPVLFDACDVIDFEPGSWAVLRNPLGCIYTTTKGSYPGKSFYVVDDQSIQRYDQIDGRGRMQLMSTYLHGLGLMPVYSLGSVIKCTSGNKYLYESRIAGILPELDEAIREYSDLQAAKVVHLYPERWEYTNQECNSCKGTGQTQTIINDVPCSVTCTTCTGRGYVVAGPYSKIMVKPNGMGESPIPTPPAGYVEKDVEIIKIQEESVRQHIYDALAAINFEFLAMAPLNQSGVAKEVDKDELNNTVHAIAEDIVKLMDSLYRAIARYRYRIQYSFEDIEEMLPTISVPEKFDILSSTHLEERLKNAKTNKTNAVILNALEIEYAAKAFNADPEVRDMVELVLKLDPLANVLEEDKMTRLSNKGITLLTYIVSSNIQSFVQRAIDENKYFAELETPKQKEIMIKYAQEQIDQENVDLQPDIEEDSDEPEEISEDLTEEPAIDL